MIKYDSSEPGVWEHRSMDCAIHSRDGGVVVHARRKEGASKNKWECVDCMLAAETAPEPEPTPAPDPKRQAAKCRVALNLLPAAALTHLATAMLEGSLKYGSESWASDGARASLYIAAAERHLLRWRCGQDCDPITGVHHLASVMASCAILLDSASRGNMDDDRRPQIRIDELIAHAECVSRGLMDLYSRE